jgi:alcohol dehydrogenase
MRAYRISRFGSVDGIELRSTGDPRPGVREILMRVRASSLNYRDLMVLKGGGRGPTKLGVIPLSDGAGEVAAIGDGVTRAKVGDRIASCFHPRWFGGPIRAEYLTDRHGANLDGMLAEYAVLSEEALVRMPSHLSFEEAATLPCAAVTAWVALTGHRRVTAGDTVLIQGSGGVSVFALQFAQVLGAQVIATTSTAAKAERLKELGAPEVVDYTETANWDEKARELTGGRGVDCVVEIGGPGTIAMLLKALAVGGHVSLIGASLSSSGTGLDPLLLTGRGITLGSISVGSRTDFEAMNRASEIHRLHPVIDQTFPFADAKEAYRHFEGRAHFGKVVITH